jgi:NADPH:quinone reductase-like Zn-dependent oxidoreductase
MKAIICTNYGPPDVLQLEELPKPAPRDDEVLIRVYVTTVTATDCAFRNGKPFITRFYTGLKRPKNPILGTEFAGEVEAVGKGVKSFSKGDRVFGTLPGSGAYAEYLCLPEAGSTLAIAPANLTHEDAVACCDGFLTALPFLRDKGGIKRGQAVLIHGASGSVGTAAVQLAHYFGAVVTGVCSTTNLDLVRSLGADTVIDYTQDDFTQSGESYDIIFDTVGKTSFGRCKESLKPDGIFLEAGIDMSILPTVIWTSKFGRKKAMIAATGLRPASERTKDLTFLKELMEAGHIKPVIDRRYPLEQVATAHRYVDRGHKKGNVVITVGDTG